MTRPSQPPDSEQGRKTLEFLARLESVSPRPVAPPAKPRALRVGWACSWFLVMFGPPVIWLIFSWSIQFSSRSVLLSALLAVPTCLVLVGLLLAVDARWEISDPSWRGEPRRVQLVAVWFGGYLASWSAVFLVLVALAVQGGDGPTGKVYRVAKMSECTIARCRGCTLRASVVGDPPLLHEICVARVRPEPEVGDLLVVLGHYNRDGVFITGVRHGARRP